MRKPAPQLRHVPNKVDPPERLWSPYLSLGSYWVAIWAFTKAPVALVAALRETSVLFAMLIGLVVMHEPVGRWRWGAAGLIVSGIALMRV